MMGDELIDLQDFFKLKLEIDEKFENAEEVILEKIDKSEIDFF